MLKQSSQVLNQIQGLAEDLQFGRFLAYLAAHILIRSCSYNIFLIGLASCVEVWHPKDLEPPLFRCDICDFDTNFKHIVEHLMGKQHKMEYFVSLPKVTLCICIV